MTLEQYRPDRGVGERRPDKGEIVRSGGARGKGGGGGRGSRLEDFLCFLGLGLVALGGLGSIFSLMVTSYNREIPLAAGLAVSGGFVAVGALGIWMAFRYS